MKQPKRIRRSVSQWQQIMSQFARSDLSVSAFCAHHAIAQGTFQRWRQKLSAPESASPPPVDWVPVQLPGAQRAEERPWDIELTLPGGVHLRMRAA